MKPKAYVCPHHPEVVGEEGDKCPKCNMDLIPENSVKMGDNDRNEHNKSFLITYKPILIIISLVLLSVLSLSWTSGSFDWKISMRQFMAGFFLIFSGFKFLDLRGFAHGYSTYDLLAKHWYGYGYIYPFLELKLGLLYLTGTNLLYTSWFTVFLMTFSGIGVVSKVLKGKKIKCVCLGTIIDVPLTTVTIIEDFGMAAMALAMLIF